ncbi:UDP-glucuronate 5-epimerase [Cereibacter changlensis JA139]|uniref:UDP-glucuronate 5-epimerase n=2 Tax=Cereibacter changlensis TaxID=402884 RepID=A0A2T4JWR2_9RHOB|nr:NAD-dependent epimerase/dehydratase family protein [Cereibacter changlensis]PTE22362.1 UDP-glucuronate 5-epimerase [Cereibacter changlensis JA139]PZX54993.1 UDP-glucuronate 4-epimerase [Cereibacter changlensis]
MPTVFITGTAGFIGFHLARELLAAGFRVVGFDGMTDYYDVALKRRRHAILLQNPEFSAIEGRLEDADLVLRSIREAAPDVIVHLAAQAGVRYSLENPRSYVESNLVGTFNVMEAAREIAVGHLLMASTSSVYGGNTDMPFEESQRTDMPLTLYAATKKANEHMAHSYAHLWKIPTTMFRFFTVYGPYGRPDLALFKFVRAALAGEAIDVYNHGDMARDFTYVGDLVRGIRLLIDCPPQEAEDPETIPDWDSLSRVAPFRVVNIGNGQTVRLLDFIEETEKALGMPIRRNMLPMQKGDVPATWANSDLLFNLTGFRPDTPIAQGIGEFVAWYREYYDL